MATRLKLELNTPARSGGTFSWLFTPTGITFYANIPAYNTTPSATYPIGITYGFYHNGVYYSHEAQVAGTPIPSMWIIDPNKEYGYDIDVQNNTWTISASNRADSIAGSNISSDTIDAGGGSDTIEVHDANSILGGLGNDDITANDRNTIDSSATNLGNLVTSDTLFDNDTIQAHDKNLIYSGIGDDSIVAHESDTIYAGDGNDQVRASDYSLIFAGNGNDTVSFDTGAAHSTIIGGNGQDSIVAGSSDVVFADGTDNDTLANDTDFDTTHPGSYYNVHTDHNDIIELAPMAGTAPGSTGATLYGGRGKDTFKGAEVPVTIMDYHYGHDLIHFNTAFDAGRVHKYGYGDVTIRPEYNYQKFMAGTDHRSVIAAISDAIDVELSDEDKQNPFLIYGNTNNAEKAGRANTLRGGDKVDTIYAGDGDLVIGGGNVDFIYLNGINNVQDTIGLSIGTDVIDTLTGETIQAATGAGNTDTVYSFQQGWDDTDDIVWYMDHPADITASDVLIKEEGVRITQRQGGVMLRGISQGKILLQDEKGLYKTALLGDDGYFNDPLVEGNIFVGTLPNDSDKVSFEYATGDIVADLGNTGRFAGTARYSSVEQVVGGSSFNTLVGAADAKNTLYGGMGVSSLWGGGASDDVLVSGEGTEMGNYTTYFYGTGDGKDTIKGFMTADNDDPYTNKDTLVLYGGDVEFVDKKDTSIFIKMKDESDRNDLTIQNSAAGLFNRLISVNVKGNETFAKVSGADEIVDYDKNAKFYFAKTGGTVRSAVDGAKIYFDGSHGEAYREFKDINAVAGNDVELAGDWTHNKITYSGAGTASLWGGAGSDTLVGSSVSGSKSTYYYGLGDGEDIIENSHVGDKAMLYDVNLSDIRYVTVRDGKMEVELMNGGTLTVKNFGENSVQDFTLANGDTWNYTHSGSEAGLWRIKNTVETE